MPNFNGAIVIHTLQLIKTPATLREIVVTISKNTDLPQDVLLKPVKQTLDMGHRLGFLQKLNGRYFLVSMTFDTLISEMESMGQPTRKYEGTEKVANKPKLEKKAPKKKLESSKKVVYVKQLSSVHDQESTTTLMPLQSMHSKPSGLMQHKLKRSQLPTK